MNVVDQNTTPRVKRRRAGGDSFLLWVRVKPRSNRDEVSGWGRQGFLEIHVRALPQRGEANRSCIRHLARLLDVSVSQVSLEKGHGSVHKRFRIEGLAQREGERRLKGALRPDGTG